MSRRAPPRAARTASIVAFAFAVVAAVTPAAALPWMALTAGSPCATCHVSPQGGGARNDIGWGNALDMALWSPEALHKLESNGVWGGKLAIGLDMRAQLARLGRPTPAAGADPADAVFEGFSPARKPDYVFIPMQLQPYLTAAPWAWLQATASVNVSTIAGQRRTYPGQPSWEAQLLLHGSATLPALRLGRIQPSIGIRHDDHTMLLRADALSPRVPLITPGYAEWGAEVAWQPRAWLRLEAALVDVTNLRAAAVARPVDPVGAARLGYSARAQWLPQWLDAGVNGWLGASTYGAGSWLSLQGFAGVGRDGVGALQLELSRSTGAHGSESWAAMAQASWPATPWLVVEGRLERAQAAADIAGQRQDGVTSQAVLGVQFFPLPYLELRPEYRLWRSDRGTAAAREQAILGQYALQVHAYF